MKSKDMFDLQHNLVSILHIIKGILEAHRERSKEGAFKDEQSALKHAQEAMTCVLEQTDRALKITKKIGATFKVSVPKSTGPESVKLVWIEVGRLIRKRYPVHAVEFLNPIADNFPKIICSRSDLTEILYCLCDNAIQAMAGTGRLILRGSLGFRAGEDPVAILTLADTGPGMSEEVLSRIFEPFLTTKRAGEGHGLGLCIVKGLVRKNGGTISVSSFEGSGTTITLTFPVARSVPSEMESTLSLS